MWSRNKIIIKGIGVLLIILSIRLFSLESTEPDPDRLMLVSYQALFGGFMFFALGICLLVFNFKSAKEPFLSKTILILIIVLILGAMLFGWIIHGPTTKTFWRLFEYSCAIGIVILYRAHLLKNQN